MFRLFSSINNKTQSPEGLCVGIVTDVIDCRDGDREGLQSILTAIVGNAYQKPVTEPARSIAPVLPFLTM